MTSPEFCEPFKGCFAELIASCALRGNLKEAKTGEYIVVDSVQAINYGFNSPDDLIGLTAQDGIESFIERMASERSAALPALERAVLKEVIRVENKVLVTGEPALTQQVIPACSGIISIARIVKQPVFAPNKKIIAICTTDTDITYRFSLFDLLRLYTQHFRPAQAIPNFLRYLGLTDVFEVCLSLQEATILIASAARVSSKQVACQLGLRLRTVEGIKARLRRKLKPSRSLGEITYQLRVRFR